MPLTPSHVRRHWSGTSCLCACHYYSRDCDDATCRRIVRSEALVAQREQEAPTAVSAAEPFAPVSLGFATPFGRTTRFGQ